MWQVAPVTPWTFLRRILPILAIVGLVLSPLAAPVDASAREMAGTMASMASEMPGCPPKLQIKDCGGTTCPTMATCVAKCFQAGPIVIEFPSAPVPVAIAALDPRDDDQWARH
jgi:hypothetical protein